MSDSMNISFSTNDDNNDFLYSIGRQNNGILQLFNKHLFSRASLLSIENSLLEKLMKNYYRYIAKHTLIFIVMETNNQGNINALNCYYKYCARMLQIYQSTVFILNCVWEKHLTISLMLLMNHNENW